MKTPTTHFIFIVSILGHRWSPHPRPFCLTRRTPEDPTFLTSEVLWFPCKKSTCPVPMSNTALGTRDLKLMSRIFAYKDRTGQWGYPACAVSFHGTVCLSGLSPPAL